MLPTLEDLDPITQFAIPVFLLSIALEYWLVYVRRDRRYAWGDAFASLGMGLGSVPLNLGMKIGAFFVYGWLYQHRVVDWGGSPWMWVALVFADDLAYYCHHRANHEVRLLWAGHVNHHSSEEYNFAVALRQGWGELLPKYVWYLWLPLLGFPPLAIFLAMAVSLIYQFFLHTEGVGRLGFLEAFLNTPSHHRVHHGSNLRYLDRNYGGILIIWDRLFGSFEPERAEEPVKYGLTHNLHTNNLWTIAFHEYRAIWADLRRAPDFRTRVQYLVQPPGWSHDRPLETARHLQSRSGLQAK